MIFIRKHPTDAAGVPVAEPEKNPRVRAYWQVQGTIDQTYPRGHFLAITEGGIVADGTTREELMVALRAAGTDAANVLVVQAGADYPRYAIIYAMGKVE